MMENILLNINEETCVKYDLKGSRKKRYIAKKQKGQVLLDNNFLFDQSSRPLALNYAMRRLLQIAINNDTFFLAKSNIVDYSLLAIIDKEK
jgi:1-phosphatidylinositol-3-phosphate 5-kinase